MLEPRFFVTRRVSEEEHAHFLAYASGYNLGRVRQGCCNAVLALPQAPDATLISLMRLLTDQPFLWISPRRG
ncbi:MAG: hypothetical protein O3C40_03835 [Planctomycetota bacterium]|nr:hypothetical protein [Planctomycetota bacterium]